MTSTVERLHTPPTATATAPLPPRWRAAGVALAVLAPSVVWLVAEVSGTDVQSPAFQGSSPSDVGLIHVVATAGGAALVAWGLLALLQTFTRRARRAWTTIAIAVLAISLASPFSGTGITMGNRLVLVAMHIAVGAPLIPLLRRTVPSQRPGQR